MSNITYKRKRTKVKINFDRFNVLVATRTNKHISVQLLAKKTKQPITSFSTQKYEDKLTKTQKSEKLGQDIADYINQNKIKDIIFDRNGFIFHGRIATVANKALASAKN